jgi:hypothetical protein
VRLHVRLTPAAGAAAGWGEYVPSSHAAQPTTTLRAFLDGVLPADWHLFAVRVQGVAPPLEAPLETVHAHLRGPDGFLHVCVVSTT